MKREIICVSCSIQQKDLFPTGNPYPGEYVKFVAGIAFEDYTCDLCGVSICAGEDCVCQSISTDRRPYKPWEHGYVKIKEEA